MTTVYSVGDEVTFLLFDPVLLFAVFPSPTLLMFHAKIFLQSLSSENHTRSCCSVYSISSYNFLSIFCKYTPKAALKWFFLKSPLWKLNVGCFLCSNPRLDCDLSVDFFIIPFILFYFFHRWSLLKIPLCSYHGKTKIALLTRRKK